MHQIGETASQVVAQNDPGGRGRAAQALDRRRWRPASRKEELWYAIARGHLLDPPGLDVRLQHHAVAVHQSRPDRLRRFQMATLAGMLKLASLASMMAALRW